MTPGVGLTRGELFTPTETQIEPRNFNRSSVADRAVGKGEPRMRRAAHDQTARSASSSTARVSCRRWVMSSTTASPASPAFRCRSPTWARGPSWFPACQVPATLMGGSDRDPGSGGSMATRFPHRSPWRCHQAGARRCYYQRRRERDRLLTCRFPAPGAVAPARRR
jgi:hypothetical protein